MERKENTSPLLRFASFLEHLFLSWTSALLDVVGYCAGYWGFFMVWRNVVMKKTSCLTWKKILNLLLEHISDSTQIIWLVMTYKYENGFHWVFIENYHFSATYVTRKSRKKKSSRVLSMNRNEKIFFLKKNALHYSRWLSGVRSCFNSCMIRKRNEKKKSASKKNG